MSVTITWLPNTESDIASYEIQRAPHVDGHAGPWDNLATILHDLEGEHFDPVSQRFFYVDLTGTLDNWYHLRAKDTDGNTSGYSTAFQPSESTTPPPFPNTVALYEHYSQENLLRFLNPDGAPIPDAQIRVYRKIDYDLNNFAAVLGTTTTTATGGWAQGIIVEAGYTYVIHFFKPGAYGPNTCEIVVP